MSTRTIVLYAEDSDDDAFLMQRAFAKVKFPGVLAWVVVPLEQADQLLAISESVHSVPGPATIPNLRGPARSWRRCGRTIDWFELDERECGPD